MVAGMVALLILGLHPPAALSALIARGAAELGGAL
jgi:hydrogenase-4 component F